MEGKAVFPCRYHIERTRLLLGSMPPAQLLVELPRKQQLVLLALATRGVGDTSNKATRSTLTNAPMLAMTAAHRDEAYSGG